MSPSYDLYRLKPLTYPEQLPLLFNGPLRNAHPHVELNA
jgi:hypothetical protein